MRPNRIDGHLRIGNLALIPFVTTQLNHINITPFKLRDSHHFKTHLLD